MLVPPMASWSVRVGAKPALIIVRRRLGILHARPVIGRLLCGPLSEPRDDVRALVARTRAWVEAYERSAADGDEVVVASLVIKGAFENGEFRTDTSFGGLCGTCMCGLLG